MMKQLLNDEKGENNFMDQLYTVNEMMSLMKVSRGTIYRFCDNGILPYVQVGGARRFIGSQVMKAIKNLQKRQVLESLAPNEQRVLKYTLSDVTGKLSTLNDSCNNNLEQSIKDADNNSESNNV